jgi:hypothetical protein
MLRPYGIDAHIGARIGTRIAVRDDIPSPARHAGAPHRRYRRKRSLETTTSLKNTANDMSENITPAAPRRKGG